MHFYSKENTLGCWLMRRGAPRCERPLGMREREAREREGERENESDILYYEELLVTGS